MCFNKFNEELDVNQMPPYRDVQVLGFPVDCLCKSSL